MIDIQSVTIWCHQKDGKLNVDVRCPDCGVRPQAARTTRDDEGFAYLLGCPKCNKTLVRYSSPEELPADLKDAVGKWRI